MSWRIPEADIERVKRETNLAALVRSRGVELRKHGPKTGLAAARSTRTASIPTSSSRPDKGLFHCMACGKAGNAIQFVQAHDGVSFRHAFELLRQGGQAAFTAQPLTAAKHRAAPALPAGRRGRRRGLVRPGGRLLPPASERNAPRRAAYLAGRGLDRDELLDRFQIGFPTGRWASPARPQPRGGGTAALAAHPAWLVAGERARALQRLHCRAVSRPGRGRSTASTDGGRRGAASSISICPAPIAGCSTARRFSPPEIILCEAVFDALTFWAAGFRNVTCLFGTESFTDELWVARQQGAAVCIAYDADDAGDRAAQRDAERFQAHGIEVFRVRSPDGWTPTNMPGKSRPPKNRWPS